MKGRDFHIRPFSRADQSPAQELILRGLGEHFDEIKPELNPDLNDIEHSFIGEGGYFFVAEDSSGLVGTGGLLPEDPGTWRIVRVSVAAHARQRGLGGRLTEHLIAAACGEDAQMILVETNEDWHDAIRLYERHGFVEYDRRDGEVHFRLALAPTP